LKTELAGTRLASKKAERFAGFFLIESSNRPTSGVLFSPHANDSRFGAFYAAHGNGFGG